MQNDETVTKKVVSYEETYNQIETLTSLDLMQRFSATAQDEIAGIGGSVTNTTEVRAHTEVATINTTSNGGKSYWTRPRASATPGPVYRDDYDADMQLTGRTLVQEGEIWLVDRPVEVVHTVTPIEQEGVWDAAIALNLEDWAGNYGPMPDGEHKNNLNLATCRNSCRL